MKGKKVLTKLDISGNIPAVIVISLSFYAIAKWRVRKQYTVFFPVNTLFNCKKVPAEIQLAVLAALRLKPFLLYN